MPVHKQFRVHDKTEGEGLLVIITVLIYTTVFYLAFAALPFGIQQFDPTQVKTIFSMIYQPGMNLYLQLIITLALAFGAFLQVQLTYFMAKQQLFILIYEIRYQTVSTSVDVLLQRRFLSKDSQDDTLLNNGGDNKSVNYNIDDLALNQ